MLLGKVWKSLKFNMGYYTNPVYIWKLFLKKRELMDVFNITEEETITFAEEATNQKVNSFEEAVFYLTRSNIEIEIDFPSYNYELNEDDGYSEIVGVDEEDMIKIWGYENGGYAAMFKIL